MAASGHWSSDAVRRAEWGDLTRRPLCRLRIQRRRVVSDLRAAVSRRRRRPWLVSTERDSTGVGTRRQELFYRAPDGTLSSVRVERGTTWAAGTPTKLLRQAVLPSATSAGLGRNYDVAKDGQRFLMIKEPARLTRPRPRDRRRAELVRGVEAARSAITAPGAPPDSTVVVPALNSAYLLDGGCACE